MQTFLPYPDYAASAKVLDRQRLGKQRVENLQIIKALLDPTYGWQNHPAVKMWRGHIISLLDYQAAICSEWVGRGYKDTCLDKSFALLNFSTSKRSAQSLSSWTLEYKIFFISYSGKSENFFATILVFGTTIPRKISPSPYCPNPVLKNLCKIFAFSKSE